MEEKGNAAIKKTRWLMLVLVTLSVGFASGLGGMGLGLLLRLVQHVAYHGPHPLVGFADCPFCIEIESEWSECFSQGWCFQGEALGVDRHSCEEPFGQWISELVDFQKITSMIGDEGGEPRKQTNSVRAGNL